MRGHYHCRLTHLDGTKGAETVIVFPAAAGFGPGNAYDSSEAYDQIAHSAIALSNGDWSEACEWHADTHRTVASPLYLISRKARVSA